jgi:hypothetical protein
MQPFSPPFVVEMIKLSLGWVECMKMGADTSRIFVSDWNGADREHGRENIRIVIPVETGIQTLSRRKLGTILYTGSRFSSGTLDSRFRRNNGEANC